MSLEYAGFRKLRPNRIHVFCPRCGRKQSNMPRDPESDPPRAVLVHVYCDRCSAGCKDVPMTFLDARGRELEDIRLQREKVR